MTDITPEQVQEPDDGYTDEECPAWNHSEDEGFDQYVVCLRCGHYQQDCPHECGPEFSFEDVAYCLEQRAATIATLTTALQQRDEDIARLRRIEEAARAHAEVTTPPLWSPDQLAELRAALKGASHE